MQLPPLSNGKILRRYKRFLADIELTEGERVTAHCPNTGSMRTCWVPDAPVQLSYTDNPKRKLPWTLERIDMGQGWIGVHTGRVNGVIGEALNAGRLPGLEGYDDVRAEVTYDADVRLRSRFDFLLTGGVDPDAWVEVKNVTLLSGDRLTFPDAVSERGRKHLEALASARQQGFRALMIYALNRPEGLRFAPAEDIDPVYAATLRRVVSQFGVEVLAVRIRHGRQSMSVSERVEVDLG